MTTSRFTAGALTVGAAVFVLLLAGVASGALTEDPPAISPYATGSPGNPSTTTLSTGPTDVATETTSEAVSIVIADFAFGGATTATVGEGVTVLNTDGATHTWTSRDGLFDSQSLRSGDSFTHVFDAGGTFEFFCAIHPTMTGSITVSG